MKKFIFLFLLWGIFCNAQYNLFARQNFNYKTVSTGTNTEIGGVASTISTPALLATKLGISVGAISNFTIVGSDIKCRITGSYAIPISSFVSTGITYFNDIDGLATSLGPSSLATSSLKWVYFKNVTSIGASCFADGSGNVRDFIYLPNCINLGSTVGNDGCFNFGFQTKLIYTNPAVSTNNGGSPDGDLAYAISQGSTIRYITNFTAPNQITTLAGGTIYNTAIQLNFTTPSSTNAIDYYEIYLNNVLQNQKITTSGQYITGLSPNTVYSIALRAVDIFYNKSVISNVLSVSTINTILDADANAYMLASNNGMWQPEINTLFTSLKSNSLYTKIQAFYPFLGTTSAQHKWNGKNPLDTNAAFRLTFTGTGTFSDLGYLTNGGHADTYFIPNSNQNVNNNGLTVVVGTNNAANINDTAIGAFGSGSNASWIVVKGNNTTYLRELRLNFAAVQQTGTNEAKGIWTGTRQSSTVSKLFRNSTLIGSVTATGTLPIYPIWIGDLNNNGSAYGSTSQRIQSVWLHEGLSDAEIVTFHTIISTFENALGRKTW